MISFSFIICTCCPMHSWLPLNCNQYHFLMLLTVLCRQFSDENKICANVWWPCFFGVNPTYGVLLYSIIIFAVYMSCE